SSCQKQKLRERMPEVLITTPESLHVMLAQKGYPDYFIDLDTVVINEWHELLGAKRCTQTELGLPGLKNLRPQLSIWGIFATIGNLEGAREVLLAVNPQKESVIIKADVKKQLSVTSNLPNNVD